MGLLEIKRRLQRLASKEAAKTLQWFFKTGPGEYGEGDVFIQFTSADEKLRERIYNFYLAQARFVNNWDLVDGSAPYIVGPFLWKHDRRQLYILARSNSLWERRIAILSTLFFIRQNDFADALKLSKLLLADEHDLIHKAVGWMLREIGKRNLAVEESFLKMHYREMPRTMLRYAIERFTQSQRRKYLLGKV